MATDFWDLVEKEKKKKYGTSAYKPTGEFGNLVDKYTKESTPSKKKKDEEEDIAPVKTRKEKQTESRAKTRETGSNYGMTYAPGQTLLEQAMAHHKENDDVPVMDLGPQGKGVTKTLDDGKTDFFQKGAFEDGFQASDLITAPLGTIGDAGLGLVKGFARTPEGLADAVANYLIAPTADLFGADKFADRVRDAASVNLVDEFSAPATDFLNDYSVLGRTSDAIAEGVGQVGFTVASFGAGTALGMGEKGASALSQILMGVGGAGSGSAEAYANDATDAEALGYGAMAGAAEVVFERLFGGMGNAINMVGFNKGMLPFDDMAAKGLAKFVKGQTGKNVVEFLVKSGFEGLEEVGTGFAQAVAKELTYMSEEDFSKILEDENLFEQFVVGALTSGISQTGDLVRANKSGRDFVSGLNADEQTVVDKATEALIAEREKKYGRKLTNKEKTEAQKEVRENLEHGGLDIDSIAEILGGESYEAYKAESDSFFGSDAFKAYEEATRNEKLLPSLQEKYDKLNAIMPEKKTGAQQNEEATLLERINAIKNAPKSSDLKAKIDPVAHNRLMESYRKMHLDAQARVKGTRLAESYAEHARSLEKLDIDVSKYTDENARKTVQAIIDSGLGDNSNAFKHFVDLVAQISAKHKTIYFDMTSNKRLFGTEHSKDGLTTNGYKLTDENGTTIVINKDAANPLRVVVGHEFAHVLEKSGFYDAMADSVLKFAELKEGKANLDARIKEATRIYKDDKDTTPEKEVVADLIGEYVFTDYEFISNLAKTNRKGFMKLFDEIKYLSRIATAGSKEARELAKAKNNFERAYRELKADDTKADGKADGKVQKSYSAINPNKSGYQIADAEKMEAEGKTSEEIRQETGWFRSYDNRWRYEIDDSKAVWHLDTAKPDQAHLFRFGESQYKLGDLLEHDELYKAYPQLKDVTVYVNPNTEFGGYVVGRNTDHIAISNVSDNSTTKWTLIHELQHIIQNIEGFAGGASKYEYSYLDWGEKEYEALAKRNEIAKKLYAILRRHGESISREAIAYNQNSYNVSDDIIEDNYWKLQNLGWNNKKTESLVDEYYEQVQILNRTTPEGQYHATAGEIEAYDTQARLNMSADERKAMRPNIDRKDAIVKYSFSKDSDGNQLSKAQIDYFKDSKMRDADGNLKPMYHGTQSGGFHTFDKNYSDDDTSFFFVDDNDVASSYSGTSEVYEATTFRTSEDMNKFLAGIGYADDYRVAEKNGKFVLLQYGDEVAESDTAQGIYEEFTDWEGVGFGDVNYKVYLNLKNPLVVDAEGRDWNALPAVNKESAQYEYIKVVEVGDRDVTIEYAMVGDPTPVTETVDLYKRFDDGLADTLSNLAPGESVEGVYTNPSTTREYAQYAKENGYDGVIFENIYDIGGYGNNGASEATVAIAFESNQIKSTANVNPTADPDIRYSFSGTAEEVDLAKGYLDSRSIQYSYSAVPTHRKSLEKNFSLEHASLELPTIMERYDKILDIWERLGGELDSKFLNDWNNKVERPFTVFKAQAGYKYNVELSSMCKKGVPLFEAIDSIVKKEVMKELNTDVLGKEEKEILYDILKKHDFEIPCAICYVEQARQREGVIIDAFLNGKTDTNAMGETTGVKLGWNQVLDAVQKEMKANGVDHNFAFVSRDIATDKYDPADLSMDEQTYAAFAEAVKKLANEEIVRYNKESGKRRKLLKDVTPAAVKETFKGTLPANLKIFKVLLTEPSSRFKIQDDLLYSSMTTKNLTMAHNGLYSLFNSQGGVSGYKTKQAPTVYWGEILGKKWKPEDTRKEGGVRNQSNSDFQMFTLLDQAQMYIDFSAKGYYLQAYTKVLSELKLFGMSKSKINASLIPQVKVYRNADGTVDVEKTMENAGLDENGNPSYDDIEGINHREAFMLLEDPEYSKNIGGICIGYSDKHIAKLLDDDRVQLIIGFHDKTNDPDKRYRGARYAKNYNGLNEAVNKDGKTVHIGFNPYVKKAEQKFKYNSETEAFEGTVTYNGKTYTADDIPRLAADLYLEMCAKKGYTPAYADFSKHRNYYKLLADFSLYDSQGHYAPHRKVAYDMPDTVPYLDADGNKQYMKTEDYIKIELQKELAVRDAIAEAMADTSEDGIIPQFIAEVNRRQVAPVQNSFSAENNEQSAESKFLKYTRGAVGRDTFGDTLADLAPVRQDAITEESSATAAPATVSKSEILEETANVEQNVPNAEDVAPIKNIQTTKGKLQVKLQNRQTELEKIEQARADAVKAYDEKIAKAQATLDGKKNKDTKVANNLKKRIERLKRLKADIDASYAKRISDINKSIDKTNADLEKDHTEKDRYEKAKARIDAMLEHDKAALTADYEQRKADLSNRVADRTTYISTVAKELYDELRSLRKGVRASDRLAALLDAGFDWGNLRSALTNVRYTPNETVNPNSAEESAVRQLINESYEEDVYAIDDLDVELAEEIQKLESEANEQRTKARTATQRALKEEQLTDFWKTLIGDTSTWRDLPIGLAYKTKTLRRILRKVVRDANGKPNIELADKIYDALETKYDHNEAELKRESHKLKKPFVDLGLNHTEYAYAHMLGELRYNPQTTLTEDVVKEYFEKHKNKINAKNVDTAIEESRKIFDELYERVNARLREQGFKEIPYRQGYFPHLEMPKQNWLQKALNWKPVNNEIPTSIAGITEQFRPQRSWQSFDKQRTSDVTDYALDVALDNYIHGALDWIYHIDDLQSRRSLENYLRYIHSDEGVKKEIERVKANELLDAEEMQERIDSILKVKNNPLGGLVTELMRRTNTLANKKASGDRKMEDDFNRKIYSTMTNLNNRVTANMVVGSFSAAISNIIPIPQSWAQVNPLYTVRGLGDFVRSVVKDDGMIQKSDYLTNRLMEEEALYQTGWDKTIDKVAFLMNVIDNITSQTVWRSKYLQNLHEGMSESQAIKDADQFAKNLMAGRSRGNAPTIFDEKNPFTKIFTAFQLEVANQYGYLFEDVPQDSANKARLIKGYAAAFLGSYLYNALYSSLVGRDAAFDPIGIIEDLLKGLFGDDDDEEDEDKVKKALGGLGEDIAQNLPFVGGLLGGGRIPLSSALPYNGDFKTMFTDTVDGEFQVKELLKPLYYLAFPAGGGQIKKTVEGLSMFSDDHPVAGSYTKSGKLRFPVEDTFGNRVQAAMFGQYANENARYYFDNDIAPLGEKQIQEYKDVDLPIRDYWDYRKGLKGKDTLGEKLAYIDSLDLPIRKQNILANNLTDRKEPIDMADWDKYDGLEEYNYAKKYPEKHQFLESIGVSYDEYESFDDDTKEAYSWAYQNPEKYTMSKAVTSDLMEYKQYTKALSAIKADKDAYGDTISGSAKEKKIEYINNLNLDYGQKIILYRSLYDGQADRDAYNADILDYLNSRSDLSYDEIVTILRELDFTVLDDGTVYWD